MFHLKSILNTATDPKKMIEEIQKIAQAKSYDMVLDKSSGNTVLFSNPRLNISEEVIKAMGN